MVKLFEKSESDGIGRHTEFKILRIDFLVGSSPISPTKVLTKTLNNVLDSSLSLKRRLKKTIYCFFKKREEVCKNFFLFFIFLYEKQLNLGVLFGIL